jgi:hypothetical protein
MPVLNVEADRLQKDGKSQPRNRRATEASTIKAK